MMPDLATATAALAEVTSAPWEPVGRLAGGETGAHEVRRADTGERAVLKWTNDAGEAADRRAGAGISERLRVQAGWPVPRVAVHDAGDLLLVCQDFRAGMPAEVANPGLTDQLRSLHPARLGLGAGIPTDWPDRLLVTLVEGGDGYCMHGPLRDAGGRERRFVEAVESLGASLAASDLPPARDLVHWDLHPGNVLVDPDGLITAVIDTDFACAGDATFDLATMAIAALPAGRKPVPEELPAAYTGHLLLRTLDWALRKCRNHEIDRWWTVIDLTPELAMWR